MMGPQWTEKLDDSVALLNRCIDYLLARNVRVVVVLLPQGTWEKNLPYSQAYANRIGDLCSVKKLRLINLINLLSDDDFGDSNHYTVAGTQKVDSKFMELARDHLQLTR